MVLYYAWTSTILVPGCIDVRGYFTAVPLLRPTGPSTRAHVQLGFRDIQHAVEVEGRTIGQLGFSTVLLSISVSYVQCTC